METQLYMNIYDINPTETFWDEVDDRQLYQEDAKLWTKEEILASIRRDGLKYQLNVDKDGNIKNGNVRYWACRYLLETEQDERFRYLPVQRNYGCGAFYKQIDLTNAKGLTREELDKITQEMALKIVRHWVNDVREQVIKPREEFPDFEVDNIDDKRLKRFWEVSRNQWELYYQPHPRDPRLVTVFATMGPGMQVDIMKPDVPVKVQNMFKAWFRDNRGKPKELAKGFHYGKYEVDSIGRRKSRLGTGQA